MQINYNDLDEKAVYHLYDIYYTRAKSLGTNKLLSSDDKDSLTIALTEMDKIEEYTTKKRAEGLRWSLTSLFKDKNMNSTLILGFYPGSESYRKFGKEVVANIEYTEDDLKLIIENIRKGEEALKISSPLHFKKIPEFTQEVINTADIFSIQ